MGDSENKEVVEQNTPKKAEKTEKTAKEEKAGKKDKTAKAKGGRIQALKAEFNRIIWPDKDAVVKETTAVVIVTVILGAIIALLDFVIKTGLDKILQMG